MTKISIIIPVYNEKGTILEVLRRVENFSYPSLEKEIIIVDDCSNDDTGKILKQFLGQYKIFFHEKNQGKGAALKTGFKNSLGDIIAIQDADLEYNPDDLAKLISPIISGEADVVYGSRMGRNNPIGHRRYYAGNVIISSLTNFLYGGKLTDVETGYKVFKRRVLEQFSLQEDDFGFEVEFTAKILKNKISIMELPISYLPRKFKEGKKINWLDGLKAIWLLVKYRFS